jgi:hypothetical protein
MSRFTTIPDIPVPLVPVSSNNRPTYGFIGPFTRSEILNIYWTQKYKIEIDIKGTDGFVDFSIQETKRQYMSLTETHNSQTNNNSCSQEFINSTDPRLALASYATATYENTSLEENVVAKSVHYNEFNFTEQKNYEEDVSIFSNSYIRTVNNGSHSRDFDAENAIPISSSSYLSNTNNNNGLIYTSYFYPFNIIEIYSDSTYTKSLNEFYIGFNVQGRIVKYDRKYSECEGSVYRSYVDKSTESSFDLYDDFPYPKIGTLIFFGKQFNIFGYSTYSRTTVDCNFDSTYYTDYNISVNITISQAEKFNFDLTD